VQQTLQREVQQRKDGTAFVDTPQEGKSSLEYREHLNSAGSPTETVSAHYHWTPGTELARKDASLKKAVA
jgi:hypothetical protein